MSRSVCATSKTTAHGRWNQVHDQPVAANLPVPDHPEGPAISVAWGNVKKGPVRLLLKFPAGFTTPNHVHSSDYRGVVVSGEFSHQAGSDAAVALQPGSTWSQRASTI